MQPDMVTGGRAVAVDRHPTDNNFLVVASEGGGIFRSRTRGETWEQMTDSATFAFTDVHISRRDPNIIFATAYSDWKIQGGGGLWMSTNRGYSWRRVVLPISGPQDSLSGYTVEEDIAHCLWVGTKYGIFTSDDDGVSWSFLSGMGVRPVFAIALSPSSQIRALGAERDIKYLFVSTNRGVDWVRRENNSRDWPSLLQNLMYQNQLAISPYDDNVIFWAGIFRHRTDVDIEDYSGLLISTDNGLSWSEKRRFVEINQPAFVRITTAVSQDRTYDVYFGDGVLNFIRLRFTDGDIFNYTETDLDIDHADCSDMVFETDGKTPLLMTSDGGIHVPSENGTRWRMRGGGRNGFNALQMTQVAGQFQTTNQGFSDVYFSTWHNSFWAFDGVRWKPDSLPGEGGYLGVPRQHLPPQETRIVGYNAGSNVARIFIAGQYLSGVSSFPNVLQSYEPPALIKPGYYIQNNRHPDGEFYNDFYLTTNTGETWHKRFRLNEDPLQMPKIVFHENSPVIFTPVDLGAKITGLKRIIYILGSGTAEATDVSGFGSLGQCLYNSYSYYPFAVDPFDPNHIIAPDIISQTVKMTRDGGLSWHLDYSLTKLVTQYGKQRYSYGSNQQISAIEFDPDHAGRILVGTMQAGVFQSCDNGLHWSHTEGSDIVPRITSFHFLSHDKVLASSFGRGLWQVDFRPCPPNNDPPPVLLADREEPAFYSGGIITRLRDLNVNEGALDYRFHLTRHGELTSIAGSGTQREQRISGVTMNTGNLVSFTVTGDSAASSFAARRSNDMSAFGRDSVLQVLLKRSFKIKGIYAKGDTLLGLVLSKSDIAVDELPKPYVPGTRIYVNVFPNDSSHSAHTIEIHGTRFEPASRLELAIDGEPVIVSGLLKMDNRGGFIVRTKTTVFPGMHTLTAAQPGSKGNIHAEKNFMIIAD